jgi:hypothetical protein
MHVACPDRVWPVTSAFGSGFLGQLRCPISKLEFPGDVAKW